jgi:predicted glycoside hydrolase/deacetylase ChbG (UPF0249 family)
MTHPTLQKLGFEPDARVVIVHADDVGMCHAANVAFWELQSFGIVTCGAVMMPCPWVPEMAAWCRRHPQADVGVHVTLTSEWQGFRWEPLSTRDPASGLLDQDGYMWRSREQLYAHMNPAAAAAEMRAQIERALAMGIDVTHIDTHMGTVMHPQLIGAYIQLAVDYQVPAMLPRLPEEKMAEFGIEPALGQRLMHELDALAASGFPVLDHICAARGGDDHLEVYKRLLNSVPAGLTHLLLHPSVPGSDIEAITASASFRMADYQTFLNPKLKAYVAEQGIHLLGYRALRALIRGRR